MFSFLEWKILVKTLLATFLKLLFQLMKLHNKFFWATGWIWILCSEPKSVNGDQACLDEGFGDREGSGTPPHPCTLSLLICRSFLKQLTSCVKQGKDASSRHCQNVIWALWASISISRTHVKAVALSSLAKRAAISFLYCCLCFTVLLTFSVLISFCLFMCLSPLCIDFFFCLFNFVFIFTPSPWVS